MPARRHSPAPVPRGRRADRDRPSHPAHRSTRAGAVPAAAPQHRPPAPPPRRSAEVMTEQHVSLTPVAQRAVALLAAVLNHGGHGTQPSYLIGEAARFEAYLRTGEYGTE